jgi:hypothetical protein
LLVQCTDCGHTSWRPLSCGHRSCPQCQNHDTSRWLNLPFPHKLGLDSRLHAVYVLRHEYTKPN